MPTKRKLTDTTTPPPRPQKSLRIVDFLALVDDGLRAGLGRRYAAFESRRRFGYLQYWLGGPFAEGARRSAQAGWMHYEIWVQRKSQRLEIGLHFEGDRERSYAAAAKLAAIADDIAADIGPEYELEEWTPSWTRLHRTFHAPTLDEALAQEAAAKATALITGMEPLLKTVGLR